MEESSLNVLRSIGAVRGGDPEEGGEGGGASIEPEVAFESPDDLRGAINSGDVQVGTIVQIGDDIGVLRRDEEGFFIETP